MKLLYSTHTLSVGAQHSRGAAKCDGDSRLAICHKCPAGLQVFSRWLAPDGYATVSEALAQFISSLSIQREHHQRQVISFDALVPVLGNKYLVRPAVHEYSRFKTLVIQTSYLRQVIAA
jgi:hypothetical protein